MTLDLLKDGQRAVVCGLDHEAGVAVRLMEMGLFEGVAVTVLRRAPLGDPLEVQVGDYRLSLRRDDARHVRVEA